MSARSLANLMSLIERKRRSLPCGMGWRIEKAHYRQASICLRMISMPAIILDRMQVTSVSTYPVGLRLFPGMRTNEINHSLCCSSGRSARSAGGRIRSRQEFFSGWTASPSPPQRRYPVKTTRDETQTVRRSKPLLFNPRRTKKPL
jgi:hypothetical protein